eukprot:TRINITY_DN682_c0_g2_i1.p1 TRINITY_DN682_c0_g2~~TRINITY_DN682_c0_g2_i1.p1  ORF type:complete len:1004 (+),score=317.32 TRINITY_DN682_c0_g2_i1:78-3089(+)
MLRFTRRCAASAARPRRRAAPEKGMPFGAQAIFGAHASATGGAFRDQAFRERLDRALAGVRKVLDTSRNPQHPADVPHKYEDKYLLAELATCAAISGQLATFEQVDSHWGEHLPRMQEWAKTREVTLRFSAAMGCTFDRTEERRQESANQRVTESSLFGTTTTKTVTRVKEHYWQITVDWKLTAYPGADASCAERIVLASFSGRHENKTTGEKVVAPRPERHAFPPLEVRLSWLLRHTDKGSADFWIDRSDRGCRTPRRNEDVEAALKYFTCFSEWSASVRKWLMTLFADQTGHAYDLGCVSEEGIFAPVLAMFALESPPASAAAAQGDGSPGAAVSAGEPPPGEKPLVLSTADLHAFLGEQRRTQTLPSADTGQFINATAAGLAVAIAHAAELGQQQREVVAAVENMLRSQLVAAIGKEVGPADFAEYMDFHNQRLYRREFRPRGFCYAVRRPDHYPEGTLSIEPAQGQQAIQTFTASAEATEPMRFPLTAASDLLFYGERHLHACVLHRFGDSVGSLFGSSTASTAAQQLKLCARARQFSSFILLVGKIQSAELFDPQAAVLVQNKDDLSIPLDLNALPTPKEFRDAIESLSPEQRRFAQAFRQMQLSSTVFGVLVIQVKPQLERLLNIPADCLTKEVELTQELMELFVRYQIPSDLVSYGGNPDASPDAKLAAVKEHVAALRRLVAGAKEKELKEAKEKQERRMRDLMPESAASCDFFGAPQAHPMMMQPQMAMPEGVAFGGMPAGAPGGGMGFGAASCEGAGGGGLFGSAGAMNGGLGGGGGGFGSAGGGAAGGSGGAAFGSPPRSAQGSASGSQKPGRGQAPSDNVHLELRGQSAPSEHAATTDYSALPGVLDKRFDILDEDAAVRPTIITPGDSWRRKSQPGLIGDPTEETLDEDKQREARDEAYDLLDALTKSGAMPVSCASLHVVLAATHCFEQTMMDTVVCGNINPIERAERSALIMASTVHGTPAAAMIEPSALQRVEQHSPKLFLAASGAEG